MWLKLANDDNVMAVEILNLNIVILYSKLQILFDLPQFYISKL